MNPQTGEKRRAPQADDLNEEFGLESDQNDTGLAYDKYGQLVEGTFSFSKRVKVVDPTSDSENESQEESRSEEDGSEDSGSDSDLQEDIVNEDTDDESVHGNDEIEAAKEVLPFVFSAPTSYSDLLTLFAGKSPQDCGTILARIRTLYSVKLAQENKQHLEAISNSNQ